MNRRSLLLTALLLATPPAVLAGDSIGQPAPSVSLPLRGSDASFTLEQLRGQVVMLNFWASWCGPCRDEFPLLDQMYRKYKSLGFALVGVNVEPSSKDAEGFLGKTPVSFPIAFDKTSSTSKSYHVEGMPSTVLIDRSGTIRWVHRGYKAGDENEYLDQIRTLLREK